MQSHQSMGTICDRLRLVAASDVGMPDDGGRRYLTLRDVRRERARCPLAAIRAWNLVTSEKPHLAMVCATARSTHFGREQRSQPSHGAAVNGPDVRLAVPKSDHVQLRRLPAGIVSLNGRKPEPWIPAVALVSVIVLGIMRR